MRLLSTLVLPILMTPEGNLTYSTLAHIRPVTCCISYVVPLLITERVPGKVEDLTDLLLEDWAQLGSCRELGESTSRFLREEMERTWGEEHVTLFHEKEAQKWLVGVSIILFTYF